MYNNIDKVIVCETREQVAHEIAAFERLAWRVAYDSPYITQHCTVLIWKDAAHVLIMNSAVTGYAEYHRPVMNLDEARGLIRKMSGHFPAKEMPRM